MCKKKGKIQQDEYSVLNIAVDGYMQEFVS